MIFHSILSFRTSMTRQKFRQWVISSLLLLLSDTLSLTSLAESYARVSTNRDQPVDAIDGRNLTYRQPVSEARSFQINSRSPVYVSTGTAKLRNGEAVDHPSTNNYRVLAEERFHPPASFEHTVAHSNAIRIKAESAGAQGSDSGQPKFPVPSYATLPKEVYSSSYDYQTDSKPSDDGSPTGGGNTYTPDSEDSFAKDEPFNSYRHERKIQDGGGLNSWKTNTLLQIPDSYAQPETYGSDELDEVPKFSGFPSSSSLGDKYPVRPDDLPVHFERPDYSDASYHSIDDFHHDLIYDRPPDDHFHHHAMPPTTTTTTEEPEVNDQRLSKRPYSYYYIGKKLWYLPLYFSIYFIIYIAALVLKSITRHKINFPAHLAAAAANARDSQDPYEGPGWYDLTKRVLDGIDLYNSIGKSRDS